MSLIKVITDEDINLKSQEFKNPRIRYASRGIVLRDDGMVALFNKSKKNEYKLPGGGIDENENKDAAFIRECLEETGCEVEIVRELGIIEEHKSLDNFKQISYVFVGRVKKDTSELHLTKKEQDEGAKLIWVSPLDALSLITNCMDNLVASEYENLYHSKFIVLRDRYILEYYLKTLNSEVRNEKNNIQ